MGFKEVNRDFIKQVTLQLAYVPGGRNKRDRFEGIFQDAAIERIRSYYKEYAKDMAGLGELYNEILDTNLGILLEQPFKEFLSELLVDIYLDPECELKIKKLRENNTVARMASMSSLLPDLVIYNGHIKDFVFANMVTVGVSKGASGILSISYSFAETIWEFMNEQNQHVHIEGLLIHFTKYFSLLSQEDRKICGITFLKVLNNFISTFLENEHDNIVDKDYRTVHQKFEEFMIMLLRFKSKRILDLSYVPLFDIQVRNPIILGSKYLEQHQLFHLNLKLLNERVVGLSKLLSKDDTLELLLKIAVLEKKLSKPEEAQLLKSIISINKKDIINTLGIDTLKESKYMDNFFKNIIRKKYIYEAILD
ncbi:hypothetical protein [uncultured Pontibacter sp.]|uniref:hypothetical protein n=1 Tax=uncultured Pontibacter sp. TaxID=453356 RepID=UPI00261126D4|nr:hypothetical protein [uncultured Pontibacter sp.]